MSTLDMALLVRDAQESFRHRPWSDFDLPLFVERLQLLINGEKSRKMLIVKIFHVEDSGVFTFASGYVAPLAERSFTRTRSSTNAAIVRLLAVVLISGSFSLA
jgi:hypothetical protein